MNKLEVRVISALRAMTKEGEYLLVDFNDLAEKMPSFVHDAPTLKDVVDRLECNGFVKVKYMDMNECCLTVTSKSRGLRRNTKTDDAYSERRWTYFNVFLFAFLGAIFGCLACGLILR